MNPAGSFLDCPNSVRSRYQRLRRTTASLREVEEQGGRFTRTFPALQEDLFCFFFDPRAALSERGPAGTDSFNLFLLQYLARTPAYVQLRRQTANDDALALVATEEFARRLLEHLAATPPAPASSSPAGSPSLLEILGIELADRARPGPAPSTNGPAMLVIAKDVQEALETHRALIDLCHGWGLGAGELQHLDPAARIALAREIQKSRRMKRLAELVGRYRLLALQTESSKASRIPEEITDLRLSDDLSYVVPSERVLLAHPVLKYDFYRRFAERELAVYALEGRESHGRGPIVICIDTSGSMAGDRELTAKAIGIGLLEIARKRKRSFVGIVFGSRGQVASYRFAANEVTIGPAIPEATTMFLDGLIRFAGHSFGGGTDYETPLEEAMRWIDGDRYPDADVVFVTDDYCEVSEPFVRRYRDRKRAKNFRTFGIVVGADTRAVQTLRKFSDRVESSLNLTDETAGRLFECV